LLVLVSLTACGGSGTSAVDAAGPDTGQPASDFTVTAEDFQCVLDWPQVRRNRFHNLQNKLTETLAVANSATGGRYPDGTIVQITPDEAMVQHATGWNTATNDWEFFFLEVNASGTTIVAHGGEATTAGGFGGTCFGCHMKAPAAGI